MSRANHVPGIEMEAINCPSLVDLYYKLARNTGQTLGAAVQYQRT